MVAQLKPELAAPSLMFEPDRPPCEVSGAPIRGHWGGWRGRDFLAVRYHEDDAWGAVVQEIILRYVLHGVERQQLAREYPCSERSVTGYVGGKAWRAYGGPVLRALKRLGIPISRKNTPRRERAITRAVLRMSSDVVLLLGDDPRPLAHQVIADLRLLTVASEVQR